MQNNLTDKINKAPTTPGVYQFLNKNGKIIYVGKAKHLRNRVKSYFQDPSGMTPKTRILVKHIADVSIIVTDSEVEALILENNLIKKNRPRYNVNLKDDKTFPYIRITNEPYPRVFVTRKIEQDGSKYIGPFTQVKILRNILRVLQKTFRIRTCNYKLTDTNVKAKKYALCLDYHIGRCDGPCQDLISKVDYNKIITQVTRFLNGKTDDVIRDLESTMQEKAKKLDFEKAKEIRDRIETLKQYAGNTQKVEHADETDRDIIALAHEDSIATVVVFMVRSGKIINKQQFEFSNVLHAQDREIMKSFLEDYYLKKEEFPDEILIPFEITDIRELEEFIGKYNRRVSFTIPKIGEKRKLISMAERNAQLVVEEMKLARMKKRKDYIPHNISSLQRDLHLDNPPKRMECFDISNIQGTDPVASMVLFENGKPKKSEYRMFKIRVKETPDDFAMIGEAIYRRYKRLRDENKAMPDLIVVDGGKGQLNVAVQMLSDLNLIHIPVISLAKRLEEVFVPGISDAQNIPKTSSSIKLLQQIRDEAHRFAVSKHRQQRKKRTLRSELDAIEGVGSGRRNELLKHFGSLKKIKNANLEQLLSVPGLPLKTAEAVYAYFKKKG